MILDDIERWKTYRFSDAVSRAFHFLEGLHAEIADGTYELDGRNLYANVMTYQTELREPDKLEAHRRYIDIQYAISGREIMYVTPYDDLNVLTGYDDKSDCEFLQVPSHRDLNRVEMLPGTVAVFFPQDAHFGRGASLQTGPMEIRKVVVKAALSIF